MFVTNIEKEPLETYKYGLNYQTLLRGQETITSCTVAAKLESTSADVTNSLLQSPNATFVNGGASHDGTTTTIQDTTKDFAGLGVRKGNIVFNITKQYRARVREVVTTTNPNDTIVFEEVAAFASEAGDDYTFFLAGVTLLSFGENGKNYLVTWTMTTTEGRVFVDTVRVRIKDSSVYSTPDTFAVVGPAGPPGSVEAFFAQFLNTDWILNVDVYELHVVHNLAKKYPVVSIWENDKVVNVHEITPTNDDELVISVPAIPDLRFSGGIEIQG